MLGNWTAPDAYAGNVGDPMSQKAYMWNRNNPLAYSDPSGYLSLLDVWNFFAGNDINAVKNPNAGTAARVWAGLSLGSNFIPDLKGAEIGVKLLPHVADYLGGEIAEAEAAGGYTSSMEKEVRNFQASVEAAQQLLSHFPF